MEDLPIEIQWHIFAFMRHPVADAFLHAEQVKEAMELAKYNADFIYWGGGDQEQERWRVGFFRELYFDNGKYYMDPYRSEVEHANSDYGNIKRGTHHGVI